MSGEIGGPDDSNNHWMFDAFAAVTYRLFGNSFVVVAGGVVGALVLFLITVSAAWTLNAGGMSVVAGLVAVPVGYVVTSRLLRGLVTRLPPQTPPTEPSESRPTSDATSGR